MQVGDEISVMRIGQRQINARSVHNKGKSNLRIKKKSIPCSVNGDTQFIAKVWAEFSRAAQAAFDGTMEEVNESVAASVGGMDTGAHARNENLRQQKHRAAAARLQTLEKMASGGSRYGKVEFSRVPIRESPYF